MQTHPAVLALAVVLASPPGRSAVDCRWMTILAAAGILHTSAAGLEHRTSSVVGHFGREVAAAWAAERTSSVAVALVVQTSAVGVVAASAERTLVVAVVASAERTSAVVVAALVVQTSVVGVVAVVPQRGRLVVSVLAAVVLTAYQRTYQMTVGALGVVVEALVAALPDQTVP